MHIVIKGDKRHVEIRDDLLYFLSNTNLLNVFDEVHVYVPRNYSQLNSILCEIGFIPNFCRRNLF